MFLFKDRKRSFFFARNTHAYSKLATALKKNAKKVTFPYGMSPARGLADKRYTPRANRAGCKQKHTAVRRYGQLALPYAVWRPFSFKLIRMRKNIMLASENAKRMSNSELNNRSSWNGDDNVIGNGYRAKNDFENAHIGAVAIITVYSTELVSGDKVEHWKKIGKDEWIEIDAKTFCQLYEQYNGGKQTYELEDNGQFTYDSLAGKPTILMVG